LNLFKQYNSTPFIGYREKLSKALINNKAKILIAVKDEKEFAALQLQIVRGGDIETELLLLFDFFDSVTVCVLNHICDNNTAIQLFKPRALDIYLSFYQYMLVQRETSATQDFGSGLEAIAKSGKPLMPTPTATTTGDQAQEYDWNAFLSLSLL